MTSNTCLFLEHQLNEVTAPLRVLVGGLVPEDVPLPFAPGVLECFIELEKLAVAGKVSMAARAAESREWERAGYPSPAEWLAMKQGSTVGRSRAELGTSEQLGELPLTAEQFRAGNLSGDQAGAIADAAFVNPGAEEDLVETAKRDSLKHTREEAARRKSEVEAELDKVERERRIRARRGVRCWTKDGEWHVRGNGPLAEGAAIEQAISQRIGEIFRERKDGQREGREQYAFDALHDLAIQPAATADSNGKRRAPVSQLTLVRVDLSALIRGHVTEGELCEITGSHPISVEEARRLFGESVVSLIVTDGPSVMDVVNLSRKPTVAQQIAKLWTDPKCVVQGCNRTVRIEYDHRVDWAKSKHTVAKELERRCECDHDKKTRLNWKLVAGTGRRAFVPPDDPRHPDNNSSASGDDLFDTG